MKIFDFNCLTLKIHTFKILSITSLSPQNSFQRFLASIYGLLKIIFSILYYNRTSLWNKACDELKKHQEFVAKVKATMPGYESEPPYGDPFTSDEIKEFFTSLLEEEEVGEDDGDEATKEELEQVF